MPKRSIENKRFWELLVPKKQRQRQNEAPKMEANKKQLPNELIYEIVNAMPKKFKSEFMEKLRDEKLVVCSSLDKYVLDSYKKDFANFQYGFLWVTNCWKAVNYEFLFWKRRPVGHLSHPLTYMPIRAKHHVKRNYYVQNDSPPFYYFEISTIQGARPSPIAMIIGLAGFEPGFHIRNFTDILSGAKVSYTYESIGLFWGNGECRHYGPATGFRDGNNVIGCGIWMETREIFFTLNGVYLGAASVMQQAEFDQLELYPIIHLSKMVTNFNTNFGRATFEWKPADHNGS